MTIPSSNNRPSTSNVVSTRTLPPDMDEDVIDLPTVHLEDIDESQRGNDQQEQEQEQHQLPTIHLEENGISQQQQEQHASWTAGLAVSAVAENVVTSVRDVEVQGGDSTRDINYDDTRAEFVSATFWKDHPNIPLGINFRKGLSDVRIDSLTEGSLAAVSPLRAGDKVLSVNNKQVGNNKLNEMQVANILRESFGCVTLVVHNQGGNSDLVESMIMKSHPKEKVGISFKTYQGVSRMAVATIGRGEKFQNSLLNPGDAVLTINGTSVAQLELNEAVDIIRDAPEKVTILARTLRETGVVVAELSDSYIAASLSMPVLQGTPPNAVSAAAATNSHLNQNSNIDNPPTNDPGPTNQVQLSDVPKRKMVLACVICALVVVGIVLAVTPPQ